MAGRREGTGTVVAFFILCWSCGASTLLVDLAVVCSCTLLGRTSLPLLRTGTRTEFCVKAHIHRTYIYTRLRAIPEPFIWASISFETSDITLAMEDCQ